MMPVHSSRKALATAIVLTTAVHLLVLYFVQPWDVASQTQDLPSLQVSFSENAPKPAIASANPEQVQASPIDSLVSDARKEHQDQALVPEVDDTSPDPAPEISQHPAVSSADIINSISGIELLSMDSAGPLENDFIAAPSSGFSWDQAEYDPLADNETFGLAWRSTRGMDRLVEDVSVEFSLGKHVHCIWVLVIVGCAF